MARLRHTIGELTVLFQKHCWIWEAECTLYAEAGVGFPEVDRAGMYADRMMTYKDISKSV